MTTAEVAARLRSPQMQGMRQLGLVLLLVFALLATTLAVPAARAAKAVGSAPTGNELSVAARSTLQTVIAAKTYLRAAGLLGCAFFPAVAAATAIPASFATLAPPHGADRLPEGRPAATPLRPPRLSA